NLVDKTEVKVHTLGTNFWTSIHEFPFGGIPVELSGKFVSGTINWLASKVWPRKNPCFIVSLDLRNESYQEILQPDYGEEYGNKESWIKLFTVSRMSNALTKAIYIFKNDQVLLESIGAWYKKLIVYDPRSDTFKFKKRSAYNPSDIPPEVCVESLLSPWS
ncbi:F-box family protein, partial [Trifolium medium]|nr:F-box family protein [Trifolium medium]